MSSANYLCKQSGPRHGRTMFILNEKNQQTIEKNYSACKELKCSHGLLYKNGVKNKLNIKGIENSHFMRFPYLKFRHKKILSKLAANCTLIHIQIHEVLYKPRLHMRNENSLKRQEISFPIRYNSNPIRIFPHLNNNIELYSFK